MPTPIRFPTEAANADSMRDDAPRPTAKEAPRLPPAGEPPDPGSREGDAKPGTDTNAPGFVRDKDARKP